MMIRKIGNTSKKRDIWYIYILDLILFVQFLEWGIIFILLNCLFCIFIGLFFLFEGILALISSVYLLKSNPKGLSFILMPNSIYSVLAFIGSFIFFIFALYNSYSIITSFFINLFFFDIFFLFRALLFYYIWISFQSFSIDLSFFYFFSVFTFIQFLFSYIIFIIILKNFNKIYYIIKS